MSVRTSFIPSAEHAQGTQNHCSVSVQADQDGPVLLHEITLAGKTVLLKDRQGVCGHCLEASRLVFVTLCLTDTPRSQASSGDA